MKRLLGVLTIVIVTLVVAGGKQTAAAKQTLTGQDALNFLQETGIYNQLTPEANNGFSPEGREFFQTAQIGATDGHTDDLFGISVARNGDTVLIGVNQADIDGNIDQGAAYVFNRTGVFWSQTTKLTAASGSAEDEFGRAVALDGNMALVGAPSEDVNGNVDQGAAYIFSQSGSSWSQQARLVTADTLAGDGFGQAVALDGSTALVGAPFEDIGFDENQGAAYVFIRANNSWSQQSKLTDWTNGEGGDRFGRSVALDGDTALVGAINAQLPSGNADRGAVYAYARSEVAWLPDGEVTPQDGDEDEYFGYAVAIDGDTALVGAPLTTLNGNIYQGTAYIFERSLGNWVQTAVLTDMGFDEWYFGYSVALEGDIAVIGAPGINSVVDLGGAVYVFVREGETNWVQYDVLTQPVREQYSRFGHSVALDGETILVGANSEAHNDNQYQGAAYVFIRENNSSWVQEARLLAVDGAAFDEFGHAVALDGNTALIGAHRVDGTGSDNVGKAYFFQRQPFEVFLPMTVR